CIHLACASICTVVMGSVSPSRTPLRRRSAASLRQIFNTVLSLYINTLSLHAALPISRRNAGPPPPRVHAPNETASSSSPSRSERSEEHTSELQSPDHLVCRLLLEKKKLNGKDSRRFHSGGLQQS